MPARRQPGMDLYGSSADNMFTPGAQAQVTGAGSPNIQGGAPPQQAATPPPPTGAPIVSPPIQPQVQQKQPQGIAGPVLNTPPKDPTNPGPDFPGGNQQPTLASPPQPQSSNAPWNSAKGFLVGFDTDKLNDPSSGSDPGSKYTPAAKDFGKIAQSVGGGRGDLGGWVSAAQQSGFPNAKAVGDDKIDFGDGNGPIDVVRSDGQVVFQNTTGNPVWEGGHPGGGGSPSAPQQPAPQMGPLGIPSIDNLHQTLSGGSSQPAGGTSSVDPFAAMGGGVQLPGGGWVPKNHPLAQMAGATPAPSSPAPSGDGPIGPPKLQVYSDPIAPAGGPVGPPQTVTSSDPKIPVGSPQAPPTGTATGNDPFQAPQNGTRSQIDTVLQGLLSGGLNQDVVNQRVGSARDQLESARQSDLSSQDAALADRGLLGSGAEVSALQKLNEGSLNNLNSAVSNIYSDESDKADQRQIAALTTGAGLSEADASNLVNQFNAQTGRQNANTNQQDVTGTLANASRGLDIQQALNQGNLANASRGLDLQDKGLNQDYTLGQGNLDVQRRSVDNNYNLGLKGLDVTSRGQDINSQLGNRGLDLQGQGQQMGWDEFLGNLGLQRDQLGFQEGQSNIDDLLKWLTMYNQTGSTASNGYI